MPSGTSGTWSAIGAASGTVLALTDYSGSLVAGGEFKAINGTMMNQVGAWNGTGWSSLGTGTDGPLFRPIVRCAVVHNGTLFVGGWFTMAGGTSSRFVANWTAPPPGPSGNEPTFVARGEGFDGREFPVKVAPNPFRSSVGVSFNLRHEGWTRVAVYGASGRLVAVLADGLRSRGTHSLSWDGRDGAGHALPSGVYFLSVRTNEQSAHEKAVLITQ
ncbi:MAG TPA: FlgD immunoglobulin-like domain containing protein [bacterium]|nr:FlgD immunoglobulin-like domain containing protein [bacterium]